MAEVQSPTLKDAPKVLPDLKSQLEKFDPKELNNVEPQEKGVLPTAEGKSFQHQNVIAIQLKCQPYHLLPNDTIVAEVVVVSVAQLIDQQRRGQWLPNMVLNS